MEQLFQKCRKTAEEIYRNFDASHDLDHIDRVMKNAMEIAATEPSANESIIKLGVLLHDIEDAKYKLEDTISVKEILELHGADEKLIDEVVACIDSVSFSGGNEKPFTSIEGAIIRDADRLDAIGAIGIARAFTFGGARGRKLYDANEEARKKMSEEEYRKEETATVTHFHEKLLLLKDLMVTTEGKRLAKERHQFMVEFLKQLNREIGS
ncbi:HD domain-containing protein [Sporosarcina jiandibaonis]|uniref:HD domain-containing protein n=1 Tax=Sporosarcina jiandibaonis TaxID=2715535 RepID=UPI00155646CE|nr:HD domain-containing protein [Sporosarcina jiandibaonis]